MKRIFFLFLLLSICLLSAVSVDEIKRSGNYFYGEVTFDERIRDKKEAKDMALANLSENISINVQTDTFSKAVEKNGNADESIKKIISTYSTITLNNLTPIIERNRKKNYYVLYYIHKNSLNTLYDDRKRVICSIYDSAKQSEKELNLSTALQMYYYASILINSLPTGSVTYKADELTTKIPERIKSILSGIKFEYLDDVCPQDDVRDVRFSVLYKGKPVESLEFTYEDDNDDVTIVANGGIATCHLTGAATSYRTLDVSIEYMFSERKQQFKDVEQLWYAVHKPVYDDESIKTIRFSKTNLKKRRKAYSKDVKVRLVCDEKCTVEREIINSTGNLVNWFKSGLDVQSFTNDAFLQKKLSEMVKNNHLTVLDEKVEAEILKTFEGWEVRSIPVMCSYPTINKHTTEYIVLDFDNSGNLQDVNFTVFNELFSDYASKFKQDYIDIYQRRHILVKFLEKYRSAYLNKDINTLKKIFSDDAVIIVGRTMPKTRLHKDVVTTTRENQPDIEYTKMDKEQFILRQTDIFKGQQDIHVGFNSSEIKQKNDDDDVYGISMRQQYASTGYSDEGYLFLLVDFKGKEPMIYVRTWQPQEWDEEMLYDLTNYEIKK